MAQRFIHYGSSCFCRYKFNTVHNGLLTETKPAPMIQRGGKAGGLWSSPFGGDSELSWSQWWERHNNTPLKQVSFTFTLSSSARILHLKKPEDLPDRYIRKGSPHRALDFEKLADEMDALLVDHHVIQALKYSTFLSWECDTLLVLQKQVIQPDELD